MRESACLSSKEPLTPFALQLLLLLGYDRSAESGESVAHECCLDARVAAHDPGSLSAQTVEQREFYAHVSRCGAHRLIEHDVSPFPDLDGRWENYVLTPRLWQVISRDNSLPHAFRSDEVGVYYRAREGSDRRIGAPSPCASQHNTAIEEGAVQNFKMDKLWHFAVSDATATPAFYLVR